MTNTDKGQAENSLNTMLGRCKVADGEGTVPYAAKEVFKEWLATVGLPDYFSIDRDGSGINATESIRQLLIVLVDEP